MLVEVVEDKFRVPGSVREQIDEYVIRELLPLRKEARSDRIRDLMFVVPVEFIFDSHAYDACLNVWLEMDGDIRDDWLEYEKEKETIDVEMD